MRIPALAVSLVALFAILLAAGAAAGGGGGGDNRIDRRGAARGDFRAGPSGVFAHYCAHCHGADGKGNGRLWASGLVPKPANLVALEADKAYLIESIREGSQTHGKSALCPPWGRTISRNDIDRLAHYLLSLRGVAKSAPAESAESAESVATQREAFSLALLLVLVAEIILVVRLVLLRRRARPGEERTRVAAAAAESVQGDGTDAR